MKSLNVLVTAGSRRVPLVRAFRNALTALGVRGRVIVTDVNPLSPAVHEGDGWYLVPLSTDPAYIDTLLAICDSERVKLVVPTIDDELEIFGRSVEAFESCGIRVAVSPEATSRICADKFETCRYLRAHGVAAAETFLPEQLPASPELPLFIKPRFGRGSVGAFAIRSPRELEFFLQYVERPVLQAFLDGPEFTIDILCDFRGQPLSIVPRERVVIRAGVTDKGRTVREPSLIELGEAIARVLPFAGPANVQCRVVNGTPIVFEINPRFSGGIPLTIAAGADFPRLLLALTLGRRVPPVIGEFRHHLWMTCYESSVFLDADRVASDSLRPAMPVGDVA